MEKRLDVLLMEMIQFCCCRGRTLHVNVSSWSAEIRGEREIDGLLFLPSSVFLLRFEECLCSLLFFDECNAVSGTFTGMNFEKAECGA
jgi:hypothetical protein